MIFLKISKWVAVLLSGLVLLTACGKVPERPIDADATAIVLMDAEITVDGQVASTDEGSAVYTANDIVYYEDGKDFTYGEGVQADAHSKEEAEKHTVVHITKAGRYAISGKLSYGQIAVDLGEGAKDDPKAVVTVILNGVDITCEVAPAVIFYRVYECGNAEAEQASKDVDTSAAGANVIIADATTNTVNGSYVARIYKPETVVLNEEGTEVADAKKLHKYDGAFYSKMSMNVSGGTDNSGTLRIHAVNEGLDSEMHLTVNGGNIYIRSGNDGINTNEDGVSVTTVNGGLLDILVTGQTGEGDGIDSNGWLVINGGKVMAAACANSADAGIDSDMGIYILGGEVLATGHMLDRIEGGGQNYAVFSFAAKQDSTVCLKNENGDVVIEHTPQNPYSVWIYSSSRLTAGTYSLWCDGTQMATAIGGKGGEFGTPQGDMNPPDMPNGENPFGEQPPQGETPPEPPQGERPVKPNRGEQEIRENFVITDGGTLFSSIMPIQ